MARNLAHIETIDWITPIEGKDRIVLAGVLGWSVIVQKADFNIGDKVVFCEIDSIFPEKPEFEFLRKRDFRIKTMKMGGVLSQGICFPLSILPAGNYKVGQDVTELMGITQYERTMDKEPVIADDTDKVPKKKYPKFLMRMAWFRNLVKPKDTRSEFPSFISKTDETRIQNNPKVLEYDCKWVATEKVDGQSGSFTLRRLKKKSLFGKETFDYAVCSRNFRLTADDGSSYWKVSEKYKIEEVLKSIIGNDPWVAIQGECIAPNIQGNKYKVKTTELYVFNVITPNGRMGSLEAKELMEKHGLKFVPIVETSVSIKGKTVDDVLKYATGPSALADTLREGIVFRSEDGKLSFKAVSPDFLIKYNE